MIPSTLGGRGDRSACGPDGGNHRSSANYDHLTRWQRALAALKGDALIPVPQSRSLHHPSLHSTAIMARAPGLGLIG